MEDVQDFIGTQAGVSRSHLKVTHTFDLNTQLVTCIPPLQKDATQLGLLALSAMLASHSVDEAKQYSSNACYELSDDTAIPLKLVCVGDCERHAWCFGCGCGNVLLIIKGTSYQPATGQ